MDIETSRVVSWQGDNNIQQSDRNSGSYEDKVIAMDCSKIYWEPTNYIEKKVWHKTMGNRDKF